MVGQIIKRLFVKPLFIKRLFVQSLFVKKLVITPLFNKQLSIKLVIRVALVCAASTCCSHVWAGIADYNAALRSGDYKEAAKETQAIWQSYDKTKTSAATLAREFAFVNYMADDFASANQFVNELNKRVVADDQPDVTAVLKAAINYRRSDRVTYLDDLTRALDRRLKREGIDNISVVAADLVYMGYWNHKQWDDVPRAAAVANKLYRRDTSALKVRAYRADIFSIAAKYVSDTQRSQYHTMSDLHDAIVVDIDRSEPGKQRDELVALKFQAQAWAQAIYATYLSYNPGGISRLQQGGRKRELKEPAVEMFSNHEQRVVHNPCDVELVARTLRYPKVATFHGMIGSVITRLQFDEDGKVTHSELLASVPAGIFADTVMASANGFYLEKRSTEQNCQFPSSQLQSFSFVIQ